MEVFFGCAMQHVESQFPNQRWNPRPLQRQWGVLTTGPPGTSRGLCSVCFPLDHTDCANLDDPALGAPASGSSSQDRVLFPALSGCQDKTWDFLVSRFSVREISSEGAALQCPRLMWGLQSDAPSSLLGFSSLVVYKIIVLLTMSLVEQMEYCNTESKKPTTRVFHVRQ